MGSSTATCIGELAESRDNNYDFLRFIAASMVIFSHAYALTGKYGHLEPMVVFTRGQFSFGSLAVKVFFVMSGFLVTASFARSGSLVRFARARFLRIFPGLALAVLVTAFVFGPFATTLALSDYYTNAHTYLYLETMTLRGHSDLPGVFESNPLRGVVNGSLWTLTPEIWCYTVVATLGVSRLLRKWTIAVLFIGLLLAPLVMPPSMSERHREPLSLLFNFMRVFSAGMFFYVFRYHIPIRGTWTLLSLAGLLMANWLGVLKLVFPLFGSYVIFFLAYNRGLKLQSFAKHGDLSYGAYIYAFPIQQLVIHWNGGPMSPLANALIALPVTLLFAFISWHLVEKRFMRLKHTGISALLGRPNRG